MELHAHWNAEVRGSRSATTATASRRSPRIGALDEPGGFGLFLVGRLADRWGVETDDGTTVWFVYGATDDARPVASPRRARAAPPSWKVTEVSDLRGDRLLVVHGELDIADGAGARATCSPACAITGTP